MKGRVLATGLLISLSCAHATLNRSKSRGPHENGVQATDVPVRGFEVAVETGSTTEVGELLAVDEQYLYVNVGSSPEVWAGEKISRAEIVKVTVEIEPSGSTAAGIWTAVGCASTASHGFFLVLTGPLWLATGIPTSVTEANGSHTEAHSDQLSSLFQYARFPQGLPPSFGGAPRQGRYTPPDAGIVVDAAARDH